MTITQPPGRPVTISRDLGPMGEYNSIFKNRLSEVGLGDNDIHDYHTAARAPSYHFT